MTAIYTAPRDIGPEWLKPGDQILMVPTAPDVEDADVAWTPAYSRPLDGGADARWMTVVGVDKKSGLGVYLDLGEAGPPVSPLLAGMDQLFARFPCEVAS